MDDPKERSDRSGTNAPDPGGMAEEFLNDDEVNQSEPPQPPEKGGEELEDVDESDLRRGE